MTDVLFIKTKKQKDTIKEYVSIIEDKRNECNSCDDIIYYCCIPIGAVLRYNIFIKSFLLHPMVFINRFFYDEPTGISEKEELASLMSKVLEHELNVDIKEMKMSTDDLKKLAKAHKKLTK